MHDSLVGPKKIAGAAGERIGRATPQIARSGSGGLDLALLCVGKHEQEDSEEVLLGHQKYHDSHCAPGAGNLT
ncbi:MAG: hypothetical protein ACRD4S_06225 [Candidatus Acidiferrales bacterium]